MPKTKPKVHILLSSVGDALPKNWKEKSPLLSELTEKALTVWNNRLPSEKMVRFLHRLPKQHGQHFRFFTVTEQKNGSLIVSKGGFDE